MVFFPVQCANHCGRMRTIGMKHFIIHWCENCCVSNHRTQ